MRKMSKLVSKNGMRMFKYGLNDNYSLLRHELNSFKSRIFKKTHPETQHYPELKLEEKIEKYNKLLRSKDALMNIYPFTKDSPLVSIIINLEDSCDLKKLFNNFHDDLAYPNVEIIVIENHPSDDSKEFFSKMENKHSLEVIENSDDRSYSESHNIAVKHANGEYLLFLDGNIKPSYGWLNMLMQTAIENQNIGCIGAKLVYGDWDSKLNPKYLYKILGIGTEFTETKDGTFIVGNMAEGSDPFGEISKKQNLRASITKQTLLISKTRFLEIGGFDESYKTQLEDADLCLKLFKNGYPNIYNPNALLFSFSDHDDQKDNNGNDDLKLFNSQWKLFLHTNVLMDKLENRNVFSLSKFKVGFAVSESGENASAGDYFTAKEFGEAIKSLGWEVCFLSRNGPDYWYDTGKLDVVISLLYTFNPRKIRSFKGSPIKIAWPRNWFDRWAFFPWFMNYDLVFTPSQTSQKYVNEHSTKESSLLPLATNPNRFNNKIAEDEKYSSDYCFTGSYWNDPREIIDLLEPDKLPYKFNLYGKNWEQIPKFKPYHKGFINYSNMPLLYASTKIVIDDANRATKVYGSVNSRVYDALACGALVLTNGKLGALEIFDGNLPVFETKDELNHLLKHYLENDDDRIMLVEKLQKFVLENHTYFNRADQLKQKLIKYIQKN